MCYNKPHKKWGFIMEKNTDTNILISKVEVLSNQKNILKLIRKYLIKNNLIIVSSTTDFNIERFIKENKFEEEHLKNIVFLKDNTQVLELLESLKDYNVNNITCFGSSESDLKILLKINELGGTSYMLNNLDLKSIELFSLIMKMIDIKYYNQLSYLFEIHDKESFKKLRKEANEEALKIFCNYINGIIKKEELLKKIYFYITCNSYNEHIRIKNNSDDLKTLNPEEINKKIKLIYNSNEVFNIINGLC